MTGALWLLHNSLLLLLAVKSLIAALNYVNVTASDINNIYINIIDLPCS